MIPGTVMCQVLAPLAGAVDHRRLVELRVDVGDRRQEQDGAPAHLLPQGGEHQDAAELARIAQEHVRLPPEQGDDLVDQPALVVLLIGVGPVPRLVVAGNAVHQAPRRGSRQRRRRARTAGMWVTLTGTLWSPVRRSSVRLPLLTDLVTWRVATQ